MRIILHNVQTNFSLFLRAHEWSLSGIETSGTWDVNLEEVWHVVSVGWYETYPEYFGDRPGSRLSDAMDIAWGGNFKNIPFRLPRGLLVQLLRLHVPAS